MLEGKNIVLCITGGIAVFKTVSLASLLTKNGAKVHVVMSKNSQKFITPLTFKSITKNKVTTDMFCENDFIPHISLSELADLIIVAPATANIIAKAAVGIADDMISTLLLASKAKKIIIPTMNVNMYENPITQNNIGILENNGYKILEPDTGRMACGTIGRGRYPEIEKIHGFIIKTIANKDSVFYKKNILITLGGTIEDIDPVRYLSNRSSGKTGFSFTEEFIKRGANVKIIVGNVSDLLLEQFSKKYFFVEIERVRSSSDMKKAVDFHYKKCDILFMSSAVADYKPIYSINKIKKTSEQLLLKLEKTSDILGTLKHDKNKIHIGFAAESQDLISNAKNKMAKKGMDFILANEIKGDKSAIGTDKSEIILLNKWNENIEKFSYNKKEQNAHLVLDKIEICLRCKNINIL